MIDNENNLDLLISKPQKLIICGEEFDIYEMKYLKALAVVEKYQALQSWLLKTRKKDQSIVDLLSDLKIATVYQKKIIDICIDILNTKKGYRKLIFKHKTKKILKDATTKQLQKFIKIVLKPILGDEAIKKMEAVNKIVEA